MAERDGASLVSKVTAFTNGKNFRMCGLLFLNCCVYIVLSFQIVSPEAALNGW